MSSLVAWLLCGFRPPTKIHKIQKNPFLLFCNHLTLLVWLPRMKSTVNYTLWKSIKREVLTEVQRSILPRLEWGVLKRPTCFTILNVDLIVQTLRWIWLNGKRRLWCLLEMVRCNNDCQLEIYHQVEGGVTWTEILLRIWFVLLRYKGTIIWIPASLIRSWVQCTILTILCVQTLQHLEFKNTDKFRRCKLK